MNELNYSNTAQKCFIDTDTSLPYMFTGELNKYDQCFIRYFKIQAIKNLILATL